MWTVLGTVLFLLTSLRFIDEMGEASPLDITNLEACDPEQIAIGMPVRVAFDRVAEDVRLLKFWPA
ncbi:hypothetical protein C2W62_10540 [Candidatus Entotheonella serta]|nr:hypothetical protein C2W62_10540 [Candidatus Entotheonella serta]